MGGAKFGREVYPGLPGVVVAQGERAWHDIGHAEIARLLLGEN